MALNLSMTWAEQIDGGCPTCGKFAQCGPGSEWFTGWPADGGPWAAGDWRTHFEEQRAHWLVARQADE